MPLKILNVKIFQNITLYVMPVEFHVLVRDYLVLIILKKKVWRFLNNVINAINNEQNIRTIVLLPED